MSYFLKILSSPERKLDGKRIKLKQGDNLVGRISPPANVCLDSSKVSKKHCVLQLKGRELKIQDLNSSNGVYVNGKKVPSSTLKEKDRIVIGEFVLEVLKGDLGPDVG